eukprot:s1450_g1.t1
MMEMSNMMLMYDSCDCEHPMIVTSTAGNLIPGIPIIQGDNTQAETTITIAAAATATSTNNNSNSNNNNSSNNSNNNTTTTTNNNNNYYHNDNGIDINNTNNANGISTSLRSSISISSNSTTNRASGVQDRVAGDNRDNTHMSGMTLQERMTTSIADAEALQKPASRCCGGASARASRAARQLERLEHLADGLCLLGPSRRRALIERLSGEQRVALERQLIRRKQEGPLQAPAAKALRGGVRCRRERRSSASRRSTSGVQRFEATRTAKRGPATAAEKRGVLCPRRQLDKDLQDAGGRRPPGLGMKRSRHSPGKSD